MNRTWEWEITPRSANWGWNLRELISYRFLLWSLVRKEFLLNYQQTILGPLWILVQPLLTLATYTLVFGKLIGIPVGNGIPPVLFYLSGIILWNFFNESFAATSRTFRENASVFSKVYFPRIVVPISVLCTQFIRFLVQLLLFFIILAFFISTKGIEIAPAGRWLLLPLCVVAVGLAGSGAGMLFAVLTAKYRDIVNIVDVCIRLLFFVTPVVYPMAALQPRLRWIISLNPLTPLFETFRYGIFEAHSAPHSSMVFALTLILLTFFLGVWLFNTLGNKLIDVV